MTVNRWFLDVDGVLNAAHAGWTRAPRRGLARASGREWNIRWEPEVIDRIRGIHENGLAHVTWCSSWNPFITEIESLLELPSLPLAFTGYVNSESVSGQLVRALKLVAVRLAVAEGERVVWTDDDAIPGRGDPVRDELTRGGRALLVTPDPRRGLRRGHVDKIEDWLKGEL